MMMRLFVVVVVVMRMGVDNVHHDDMSLYIVDPFILTEELYGWI